MKKALWAVLLLSLLGVAGCEKKELPAVRLFITADIEGVFWSRPEPRYGNEVTGGLAILQSFLQKQMTPYLLLDGGNWFAQTPEGNLSQGNYFNELAVSLPYKGRLFTEQDLGYGWGSLREIIAASPAPFILSNVRLSNNRLPDGAKPWLLADVGEYKIGVMGIIGQRALQGKQRVGGLTVLPEIESAQKTAQQLREKGAQVIVLLAALGNAEDKNALTDMQLAEEVPDIDVIISAATGREEAEGSRLGNTLLIYTGSRLDSVGQLTFSFHPNGTLAQTDFEDVILYRRDFGEDAFLQNQIEQVRQTVRQQMNRPAGQTEQALSGSLEGESSLGNWAADCVRKWAKADAAVLNASSLREGLPAGTVTQYDLYKVYPFSDHITYLSMKGDALRQALEEGLKATDNFAQISGLQIQYRPSDPQGTKIKSITVNGTPLSPKAVYRVAVTDHLLAGGMGHDGFIDSLEFKNTQVEMSTVLRLCLSGKKTAFPVGGRWKVVK